MAIELNFSKSDSNTPWGFRLVGGTDFDEPLTVIKVNENSIAENAGLQENDLIVRINETPTAGLTHIEAHDLLYSVGNNFILVVRRDDVSKFTSKLNEKNNVEISNIVQENRMQIGEEISVKSTSTTVHQQEISERAISETVCEQIVETQEDKFNELTTIIKENESTEQGQERKWSTFLQKPSNPKPNIKKKVEENIPVSTGEPYRVIIKKQKKKLPGFENLIAEKKLESENKILNETNISETEEQLLEETIETTQQEENIENVEILHQEASGFSSGMEMEAEISVKVTEEISVEASEGVSEQEILEAIEETETEDENVEDQLLQVQQQLQALSKLPTTIQESLDAITQQLSKIVSSKLKKDNVDEDDKQVSEAATVTESDITEKEHAQGSEASVEKEDSELDQELQQIEEDSLEEEIEHDDEEKLLEEGNPNQTEEKEDVNDEEERERIEAERLEKLRKEKEEKESRQPLKPIIRPIILPGGRRWSQPDDACPAVKQKKISDEKIANMIETYSEVITGKTKGMSNYFNESLSSHNLVPEKVINFLKYQPPPKNLDYLQKSEVFKLLRDTDCPVRGICSRASKVLAEEDYYEKARASPETSN